MTDYWMNEWMNELIVHCAPMGAFCQLDLVDHIVAIFRSIVNALENGNKTRQTLKTREQTKVTFSVGCYGKNHTSADIDPFLSFTKTIWCNDFSRFGNHKVNTHGHWKQNVRHEIVNHRCLSEIRYWMEMTTKFQEALKIHTKNFWTVKKKAYSYCWDLSWFYVTDMKYVRMFKYFSKHNMYKQKFSSNNEVHIHGS